MKKKTVKMVLAVVSLAVLCGTYWGVNTYVSKQEKAENSKEEEEQVSVTDTSADEIETVKFLIDKKEVAFQRKRRKMGKGQVMKRSLYRRILWIMLLVCWEI